MKAVLDSRHIPAMEAVFDVPTNISYLRPKKQDAFSYWATMDFETKEALNIQTVENGLCLPLRQAQGVEYGQGGVVDAQGKYVKESALLDRLDIEHQINGAYPVNEDQIQTRNQTVLYCGFLHHHFGHFLIEGMSPLWACGQVPDVDAYVFISSEVYLPHVPKPTGNIQRILELTGIADKVQIIEQPTRFQKVLVPELGYQRITYTSKAYEQYLQTIIDRSLAQQTLPSPAKLFFSRKAFDGDYKKEFGYDYLENLFEKNGYQIIYPEQLSLDALIARMHTAEEIIVMQGTAHHNLLFAPKGLKITVLERFPMVNEYEIDIQRIKELDATYVDAFSYLYMTDLIGPNLYMMNEHMQRYLQEKGLRMPDETYLTQAYKVGLLKQYLKCYHRIYGRQWRMLRYYETQTDVLYEAYLETEKEFYEYLVEKKPIFFKEYFDTNFLRYLKHKWFPKKDIY